MSDPSTLRAAPVPAEAGSGDVIVACSGGLDSIVLLDLLAAEPALRARGLRALHVHHGLHADADDWANQCRDACAAIDVPLQVVRVRVETDSGHGPEAAARAARHAAFAEALHAGGVLALAHHRDDQAETFLLRALRGSGVDGLAAMQTLRACGNGVLWRPLLDIGRDQLRAHADARGLQWIEDPSNADCSLDRNFLRLQVLPVLRQRWPHAGEALARSAALSAEAKTLLDEEDRAAFATVARDDTAQVAVAPLLALPRPRRARVLRHWILSRSLPPLPAQGLARIEHDLLAGPVDGGAAFKWQGAVVRRWSGLLHAGLEQPPLPSGYHARWDGRGVFELPTGDTLQLLVGAAGTPVDLASPPGDGDGWIVHARRGGERIVLPRRRHSHALKHVLQDRGIPPWVRARLPLLSTADGALLAAGDLLESSAFSEWLAAHDARLAWHRGRGG